MTSRTSSTGPTPLPMGCAPSVIITSRCSPILSPTYSNSLRSCNASARWRTLAVGPSGISISRWVTPAATFLERIEATSCPGESMESGRSTEIRISSTGANLAVPPHARQPRCCWTISCSLRGSRSTFASTSMVSAVPAGDVMARLDVLGISMP